jgi:hypothetical protein
MSKLLWALAALTFVACTGTGPSGDGQTDIDPPDTGDTDTNPQSGGSLLVHDAEYDGTIESCSVNDVNNVAIGETEEIVTRNPGSFIYRLGDNTMLSIDGLPFHVASNGDFTHAEETVEILKSPNPTEAWPELVMAQQIQCVATDCDFPYEGGACEGDTHPDPRQWVYVDSTGVLRGSETVTDVVSGVEMTLDADGVFTVTATDDSVIESWTLDPSRLRIEFTYSNYPFEVAQQVVCSPP